MRIKGGKNIPGRGPETCKGTAVETHFGAKGQRGASAARGRGHMGMGQLAQGVVTMRTVALTQEAFLMGSHQRPTIPRVMVPL